MDNETGDIYSFHPKTKSWKSECNIGVNRLPSYGTPNPTHHTFIDRIRNNNLPSNPFTPIQTPPSRANRPVTKRQFLDNKGRGKDLTRSQVPMERRDPQEDIAYVRSNFIQHPFIVDINKYSETTANNKFLTKLYPDWYLNSEGALPKGLTVIADGDKGPLLLAKENRLLLLPFEVNDSKRYFGPTRVITQNFVNYIRDKIKSGKFKSLLLSNLLFGNDESGVGELLDPLKHKKVVSSPLNRYEIVSSLKKGPTKVDPPAIDMFFTRPLSHRVDNYALTGDRESSSIGRRPRVKVQNPCALRDKRLLSICSKVGITGDMLLLHDYLNHSELSNNDSLRNDMPVDLKDIFAGRIMNENSITHRQRERNYKDDKSLISEPIEEIEAHTVESTIKFETILNVMRKSKSNTNTNSNNNIEVPRISNWNKVSNHNPPPQSARTYKEDMLKSSNNDNKDNKPFETARNFKTTGLCNQIADTHYLPVKHPKALVDTFDFERRDSKVVTLPFSRSGPYNTYKTITSKIEKEKEKEKNSKFQGTYTTPYICEDERYIKEYNMSKKNFLGGPFLTAFGKASSIPLRKEGYVRGQGPYPLPVPGLQDVVASEWIVAREYNKEKHIAGAWKA